jgi:hypothetical protein
VPRHVLDTPEIDALWLACAGALGYDVVRSTACYAGYDGRTTLTLATRETLDEDDTVAQLLLHELCHAVIEGEAGEGLPDWGLDNTSDRDRVREDACLHLQAALADEQGLRAGLAPTSASLAYYGGIGADALAGGGAALLAREAMAAPTGVRYLPRLRAALAFTRRAAGRA